MEPEQPTSTPSQSRRRWYQGLGRKLKQKILKPVDSGPARAREPSPRPASPGSHHTASGALQVTLQGLQRSADLVPPLRPAIEGLSSFLGLFEAATRNRQEYQKMASDLNITLQFLKRYLDSSTSTQMTETITEVLLAVQEEINFVQNQQDRGTTGRLLDADYDEEDLVRRYRRIEQLFHRLQLEVSMGSWHAENASRVEERLNNLRPAKLATHNSILSMEVNRRRCTENTRKGILSELNTWSDKPDAEKVFWMDGMAGTGKTTIACTLSESLDSRGQLAASFFCTRNSPECRDANRIVPTIAYQLARHSTPFMSVLGQALEKNPDMSSLNISAQFQKMLKDPLSMVKEKLPNNLVVVIDALDECEDSQIIGHILKAVFQFAKDLPIKFFITSRPEAAIREKMMSPENASRSILHLHDIEASLVQEDIELYLQEELEPMSPSPTDVKQIATLANNLFIYAATAVRYIRPGKGSAGPRRRLAQVLAVDTEPGGKFNHIDSLYSTVLSTALNDEELEPEDKELTQLVLRTAVCAQEPIPVETLAALCGLPDQDLVLAALRPLRSVLHVSDHTNLVSTLHASFPDYIFTQSRSGQFFCDESAHNKLVSRRCLDVMKGQLRFNMCNLPSSFIPDGEVPNLKARIEENISPSLSYACRYWTKHLANTLASDELCRMVDEFLSQRLLFWMEVLNLKECITMGGQGLVKVQAWLKMSHGSSNSIKFANDAHKFVVRFSSHTISLSTPHIYISALPFCPPSSLVSVHYRQRMQGVIEVKGTAIIRLGQAALATWTTDSSIRSVAYSPDGVLVASGGDKGTICIRNVHDGKVVVGPFNGHRSAVSSIAFSLDGSRIASGSRDRTVRVWDSRDGAPATGPFEGHPGRVESVAFSPDGTCIVSGSDDRTIRVWDARTGTLAAGPFRGHFDQVNSVGYSPDGTRIISGSHDYTIQMRDAKTGALIHSFEGHTDRINSAQFSPNGEHIVSGSRDRTVRVWNVCDGTLAISPLEGHTHSISSVAYSSNGALIVSSSYDRIILVWNAHDGTLAAGPFEGHTDSIFSVDFSPDGEQIVSGSHDRSICIWSVFDNLLSAAPPKGHSASIYSAKFSPDGMLIATGSWDSTIRVWGVVDGTLISGPFKGHTGGVLSVAFSPDSARIASGSYDHTVRVWHTRNGTLLAGPFKGHSGDVNSVAFSPDGLRLASGSDDETICVWDVANGTLLAGPFKGHTDFVLSVTFSPDGTCIASASEDMTIRIWNSFDGNQIVNPLQKHSDIVASGHTGGVTSVAFSPDDTQIISGSRDQSIHFWDATDGTPAAPPFRGHAGIINSVAFSPDGSSILSCSADQTLRVWDVEQKQRSYAVLADPWEVQNDGWVLNAHSQLLFWVPAEIRNYFPRLGNPFTIGPLGTVQVDFNQILLGKEWAKCWLEV